MICSKLAADRLHRLYSGRMTREISTVINYTKPAKDGFSPTPNTRSDDDVVREREPASLTELPALVAFKRQAARANLANPSDYLSSALPANSLEGGIETAMLGGKVRWMGTRYHTYGVPIEPLIRDYADFDWSLPDEDNMWFQRYLDAYRFFVKEADGDFAIGYDAGFVGMNLAVQLRGTERAYLDMYEEPENLQRLLNYSLHLNTYLYGRIEEIVGTYNRDFYGDHPLASYRVDRQPGCSVDAYSLCASGTLSAWGRDQFSTFISLVGGATLHIHENSRQVIEEVAAIEGWRIVSFSDARGYPRSFDIRWELRSRMGHIPVRIFCKKGEFLDGLEAGDLPGNTQYVFGAESLSEAEDIMDGVLSYTAPIKR